MSYFSPRSTWLSLVEETSALFPKNEEASTKPDFTPVSEQTLPGKSIDPGAYLYAEGWDPTHEILEDTIHLAQSQKDAANALFYYCQARHIAKTMADEKNRSSYVLTWLELDKIIAEIHILLGNFDSSELYAREGLDTIRHNKFTSEWDPLITKMALQFFNLLGRSEI